MNQSKRTYMVYGVGNGLVDKQVKVTDVELEELELAKGGMALTDQAGQAAIMTFLGDRDSDMNAGGSAANTIIGMAQMGGRVAYACSVGDDSHGGVYLEDFRDLGIQLTTETKSTLATGTCLVLITPDGERTMNTHLGASTLLGKGDIDQAVVADSEWIYAEGYLLTGDETRDAAFHAFELAKANDTKIAFTFSDGFIVESFGDDVQKIVADYADLIFANEREAAVFTGKREPEDSLETILKLCESACVTMGEHGSYIHYQGERHKVAAIETTPLDLTGAGDMYAAGVLYGLCGGWSPDRAARLGSQAAHDVVIQFGARLPGDLKQMVTSVETA